MSKTTPEEARALAQKYCLVLYGWDFERLAALIDEARGVDAEPFMHVYEFASPFGGTVWRDSPDTWNGNQSKRSLPLYTHPAPSQPAAKLSDEPFADWLDANRGLQVSEVFHEIIKRHRATLNAIGDVIAESATPVELPVVGKE